MFNSETTTLLRTVLDEVCEQVSLYENGTRAHAASKLLEAAAQGEPTIDTLKETGREGTRKRAYDVALMLLGSEEADRIQSAVDEAYASLPGAFKTEEVRKEIAKAVVRSGGDYENRSMQECPARPRSTCRN